MATLAYLVRCARLRLFAVLGTTLLVVSLNVYAARFGQMQVVSQKGEPLRAKIEILDVPLDEQGWLTLQSAPQYAYQNAALRFTNAAKELRAMVERDKDGKMIAWLTTSTPVNEEFIDLLLTLNWSTGRMTEAFTILVPHHVAAQTNEHIVAPLVMESNVPKNQSPVIANPTSNNSLQSQAVRPNTSTASAIEIDAGLDGQSSSIEVKPATVGAAVDAKIDTQPIQIVPKPIRQQTQAKENMVSATQQEAPIVKSAKPNNQTYKVVRGDTLSKIAQKMMQNEPEAVTLDQLLWGLYQDNPQAFMGKNMNRLKAGAVLQFPEIDEVSKIDAAQAHQQVQVQAGEFERYRDSLAAAATVSKASSNARVSSGQISAAVKENLANQPADKLELSRGDTTAQQREEQKIAQQRAATDAKEQVDQLEKQVADLQKLAALTYQASPAQVAPAAGVPVAVAKQVSLSGVDKTLQKIQSFFSHNPAAALGILLTFLVSGAALLRRRVKRRPLFPERAQHEVPLSAQKMLTSLNLDLGPSPATPQKDLVSLDQRIQTPDQMNTRLELAQAYWDLGDQQGARQLLEEVVAQGNAEQRKQAQTLLSNLH